MARVEFSGRYGASEELDSLEAETVEAIHRVRVSIERLGSFESEDDLFALLDRLIEQQQKFNTHNPGQGEPKRMARGIDDNARVPTKAQSGATYFNDNSNTSPIEGVNPYEVASEFESENGVAGGQPGVNLNIKGADHG
jgi:hypothetical protein